MTKADSYRKRAKSLGKRMSNRQVQHTTPVGRKQKALNDMADNEDWLDGKIKPKGIDFSQVRTTSACEPQISGSASNEILLSCRRRGVHPRPQGRRIS